MKHPDFINSHTAFAVLILIVGCFLAGYFVGRADHDGTLFHVNGDVNNVNY